MSSRSSYSRPSWNMKFSYIIVLYCVNNLASETIAIKMSIRKPDIGSSSRTEWRNCNVIGILSIALRIASDSGCPGMYELTSDFVTCHVCKSPRQFNYRTKADAIVRRSSPSVLCVWICAVCTGRWDDFSTFAVRYPHENPSGMALIRTRL